MLFEISKILRAGCIYEANDDFTKICIKYFYSFFFFMIIIHLKSCARTFSTFNSIICLFWMLIDKRVEPWFFLSLIFKLEISFFLWFIVVFIASMSKGTFICYVSTLFINCNIFTNFLSIFLHVQVNLCQKCLFSHQLTHNMTKDCSLIYQFSTWKLQAQNMVRTCCVHKLFWM